MQKMQKFGVAAKTVIVSFVAMSGLLASTLSASAETTPPTIVDTVLYGSGSDTTYDLMKALDKVYEGTNGCATIWYTQASQPFNGACDTNDLASGNGTDATDYPWVNDGHTIVGQRYPVGSGNGVKELCYQGLANVRPVDFARSSSSSSTTCSNLTYVAYAKDAVSWYHATKDKNGNPTTSANVASIAKADLQKIYNGTYTKWSELNGKAKDADGNFVTDLPENVIKVYTAQTGSGTVSYWSSNIATPKTGALSTGQENAPMAIFDAGNEADAIYFMSYGRYKQSAGITSDGDAYFGNSVKSTYPLASDALGKIDDVAPTNTTLVASSGAFPLSRNVFNVLRFPSAETLKYVGPSGFVCSPTTGALKDRITGRTYRSLVEEAIIAEGFVPLPLAATGGGEVGSSYCRVTKSGSPASDVTAPTVGVDTGATYSGTTASPASATFVFSEPVRSIDTSKFTAEGSVATNTTATSGILRSVASGSQSVTLTCYNQKSVVVADCASGSADTDPYQALSVKKVKIAVTGNVRSVIYSVAAGAGTDLAGNTSSAFTSKGSLASDQGVGVSALNRWTTSLGVDSATTTASAKTYTVKGSTISLTITGGAYVYIDGVQVYNPDRVVHNAAVAAVYSGTRLVTPAKAAYDSYNATTGKIFTSGTYSLSGATAISAGGTATTRTNPTALSTNASWKGSGWHTVKVVVQAGPVSVTAISAS